MLLASEVIRVHATLTAVLQNLKRQEIHEGG